MSRNIIRKFSAKLSTGNIMHLMNFANYLIYLRERRDINKSELARKLGLKNASYVINIESGHSNPPTPKRLEQISVILRLSDSEKKKLFELAFQQRIVEKSPDWFNAENQISKIQEKEKHLIYKVPIISWVSANRFTEIVDNFSPGVADDWIHTTSKGGNMFALKVINDCMQPEFQEGDIIIVKPNISPENGDFIIVRDAKSDTATFKQYKKYGNKIVLHPLNPKYPDLELDHDERYEIIGKIVEKVKKY